MRPFVRADVARIAVPTLMLWGEDDVALGRETTAGTERYVADLRFVPLAGVSHWLQTDATERVNAELIAFLGASETSG
jgi:pimeloyl-ACP methyl ester carboxylesterase